MPRGHSATSVVANDDGAGADRRLPRWARLMTAAPPNLWRYPRTFCRFALIQQGNKEAVMHRLSRTVLGSAPRRRVSLVAVLALSALALPAAAAEFRAFGQILELLDGQPFKV